MSGEDFMDQSQLVGRASLIGMVGAAGQVLYGLLAVFFRYPTITDSGFEILGPWRTSAWSLES